MNDSSVFNTPRSISLYAELSVSIHIFICEKGKNIAYNWKRGQVIEKSQSFVTYLIIIDSNVPERIHCYQNVPNIRLKWKRKSIVLIIIILYTLFLFCFVFKRSTFVDSAWSFVFFIPTTAANDLRLQRIFYPRCYPLHLFSYLNSWERASISLFNVEW